MGRERYADASSFLTSRSTSRGITVSWHHRTLNPKGAPPRWRHGAHVVPRRAHSGLARFTDVYSRCQRLSERRSLSGLGSGSNRQSSCPFPTTFVSVCRVLTQVSSRSPAMSTTSGTFRGTPSRGGGRGQIPSFETSSSPSAIPRPRLGDHVPSGLSNETGSSTLSASRAKQNKRDEVCDSILRVSYMQRC